jgi:hypothetical protein
MTPKPKARDCNLWEWLLAMAKADKDEAVQQMLVMKGRCTQPATSTCKLPIPSGPKGGWQRVFVCAHHGEMVLVHVAKANGIPFQDLDLGPLDESEFR